MKIRISLLALALTCWFSSGASAATIIGATGATASSTVGASYDIGNTIDQSGLSAGYTSGVTDFDIYIGTNPSHSYVAIDNEWFSAFNVTVATINYDLGSVMSIDRIALWNDEYSGFGIGNILTSIDNVLFTTLAIIIPTNSDAETDYFAQIFGFTTTAARYFRFNIRGCPQPNGGGHNGCGIGEVAFSSVAAVPLPAALPLFGTGLAIMGFMGWRRKRKLA